MKILVDIKEGKGDFILELLNSFPFVKTKKISPDKAKFLLELKDALDEVKLAKHGKVKLKSAHDLIDEL
ncbi:MAG: hypothetical protein UZ12_BCD005002794 [Bacteroidetes bacterium OLB12]|nr:MAG: hypothetical protein UZ12_BCD005002794 [Bacteroidetes bacterium OLB12]HNR73478.1 hypothetical protein [Cyclobacteriaceae bacterium]HNU41897.1 hypothetical protein [Cyclobacteriaceae bacterium]